MLEPWFPVILLLLESSEVVGLRVMKLAGGGVDAQHEARLMVNEKIDAAIEVGARLLCGGRQKRSDSRFMFCLLRVRPVMKRSVLISLG